MPRQLRTARFADADLAKLEDKRAQAAGLLKLLANEKRLLILCRLAAAGEMSVGKLAEAAGVSQSALSQHLGRMREEGLVAPRRDAQTILYHIADDNARRLLRLLEGMFCH